MDVLSHGLWAAAAALALGRNRETSRGTVAGAVAFAVVPDIVPLLPVAVWAAGQGDTGVVLDFVKAMPGREPPMPGVVTALSHHFHCIAHSALIAAAVALAAWRLLGRLWIPLVGWWAHIALDIPTHSDDYYAVPFLYPLTYWGFDGVPWTTPWVLALNFAALAATWTWLWRRRRRA